ncbi:hypothetical protein GCM10007940_21490 [Portibacter lacus]|uniref:Peptidase S9 prolyl oligopeptidase catalytic domain-containing protein n=2 Tax=Portibacter lacus TaxID=1099794 RepID=A0AA37WFD5_9BACT|nr:hypothetical protein GCM10007940_21490 [Portibacter lacus]
MDQSVYSEWNRITGESITDNGEWVKYYITPGKGDKTLVLYNTSSDKKYKYDRVKSADFSADGKYLVYSIQCASDTITAMKRRKVEKKNMPKDSLLILKLDDMSSTTIPDVGTYKVPSKWSGSIAYQADIPKDSQDTAKSAKNEQFFFIHDLDSGNRDTIDNVDSYLLAEKAAQVFFLRSGKDSTRINGVFNYNVASGNQKTIIEGDGKYLNLAIDKNGEKASFIADLDTTSQRIRPFDCYLWENAMLSKIVESGDRLTSDPLFITENTKPDFSEDGSVLYFGIGSHPVLPDSLALDDEIVQVEVWTTEDPMLYTMQELQENRLKKEIYQVRYDIAKKKFQPLETMTKKNLRKSKKGNGKYYIVSDNTAHQKSLTWTGRSASDIFIVNGESGEKKLIAESVTAFPNFSDDGQFVYWFDREELDYFAYEISSGKLTNLTEGIETSIVNELNDVPAKPNSYGTAGWTADDKSLLIYDRYDIWKLDPKGDTNPVKLTNGRAQQLRSRIIDTDNESDIVKEKSLLYLFNEQTKQSGYGYLDLGTSTHSEMVMGDFSYRSRPIKAKDADVYLYSKESFELFPDLMISDESFKNAKTMSNANPQQMDYRWGSMEIFEWKDFKGEMVKGLLVKPEGFDPTKKYPVIVNFYERSSDGLHRHRAPEPHRSTINYAYYANKGYVIFNPDIRYEIGEPGESAYNAVVSGVEALSKNQFVDKERIGVQGHSWGGYQIAYLLNKTNIFKCAESGAPVVNMVSAYGGIRWGSGMSRMFQYEKTQSRLGATLWENPDVYLRNSPIFDMDKINTPVLILHNDNDGAVPWYQGIEYFMALRRLGKPAWMLNYNGEPHWPLKWENRLDFNKRMEQFFGHYLMDQPMPSWMKKGVSVVDKGVNQGFETEE